MKNFIALLCCIFFLSACENELQTYKDFNRCNEVYNVPEQIFSLDDIVRHKEYNDVLMTVINPRWNIKTVKYANDRWKCYDPMLQIYYRDPHGKKIITEIHYSNVELVNQ